MASSAGRVRGREEGKGEGWGGGREDGNGSMYLREEIEGGLAVSTGRGEGVQGQAALRKGGL